MNKVIEIFDSFPLATDERSVKRDEALLFKPVGGPLFGFLNRVAEPLPVYTFPSSYAPTAFSPPRGVFESEKLRVEWQTMDGRQPFFHRNADGEEIGFQVCGERTQMTELGVVEIRPGHFTRIPVGVSHDNFGRRDIHLIFYFVGPAETCIAPLARGELRIPPFAGWQDREALEIVTDGLGGTGTDVSHRMMDERLLLEGFNLTDERLQLIEPGGEPSVTEWLYKAPRVWIGHTMLSDSEARIYRCHLAADEIQYQVSGRRMLITQLGTVDLMPGDFVSIPRGCSFASTADGDSRHISLVTADPAPACREPSRFARLASSEVYEFADMRTR